MSETAKTDWGSRSEDPVLILNYNNWEQTIDGLEKMRGYVPNLWVVDNGSEVDRTAEISARFPEVRTLRLSGNWGWAAGYNRALRLFADQGFAAAYLLNNDAVPRPGAVESALRNLRRHSGIAGIGSVILGMGGKKLRFAGEYYPFMTPEQRALADRNQLEVPRGLVPARALHGAGVAISLDAFREVGPFHEGYFLYWEEADWFIRAKQRGWELYVDGDSVVEHVGGASDSNSSKRYYLSRNRFLAYRRGIHISGKNETVAWLINSGIQKSRRQKTRSARNAIADGVLDGLLGRTGVRPAPWPGLVRGSAILALRASLIPWRMARKLKRPGAASEAGRALIFEQPALEYVGSGPVHRRA